MSGEGPSVSSADSNWKALFLSSDLWSAAPSVRMELGKGIRSQKVAFLLPEGWL